MHCPKRYGSMLASLLTLAGCGIDESSSATDTAAAGASSIGGDGGAGQAGVRGGSNVIYQPCPTDGTACKIMPFGDSITDGYNSDTPGGYRVELFRLANAPTRLGNLIDSIYAQLPEVLIVVAQPIPSRGNASEGDDTQLSGRIETYNDAIPDLVQQRADAGRRILHVDMYTPLSPDKGSLLEDEWHPNLAGHELLGTEWYGVLEAHL